MYLNAKLIPIYIMNCGDMGLDIPDHECLAMMQQQQSDAPTIIFILLLMVLVCLTSIMEESIKN